MIEYIEVMNFQKWKKKRIELSHVTTVVGPTDMGKSSILRALLWVASGKPNGTKFIRHGAKNCKVTIGVDGHTIIKTRGRTKPPIYYLDGIKYAAVGSGVPEAIQLLLGIGKTNFQSQLDSPFFLLDSAGQLAKNLNAIISLSEIDEILGKAGKELRESKIRYKLSREDLDTTEQLVSKFAWVEEAASLADKIQSYRDAAHSHKTRANSLIDLLSRAKTHLAKQEAYTAIKFRLNKIISIGEQLSKDPYGEQIRDLETILKRIVEETNVPEVKPLDPAITKLKQVDNKINRSTEIIESVSVEIKSIRDAITRMCLLQEKLEYLSNRIAQTEKQIKREFKGRCPLCAGTMQQQ